MRNFLFGPPGSGGFDLASLNIQRGRDHGLANYNQMRADFGLVPFTSFNQFGGDVFGWIGLNYLYGDIDEIDAWAGMLVEDKVPGSELGGLAHKVIADQFTRLRDGDRYWYQKILTVPIQRFVDSQRLSDIVRRNTTIDQEIADDMFHVQ